MRLAFGGFALLGSLFSAIGDFLESEYELKAALRRESLVNNACTEKEKLTRLAIEKQEQAFEKIANLMEKEIANTLRNQQHLSLAFDEINQRLIEAQSEHEMKVCLKVQLVLTGAMNEGITCLQKVLVVEAKKLKIQSQKLLEG